MRLEQFLVKAKVGTYASGEAGETQILTDGGKELTFQVGEFKYRDRYFGWNPFVGEEVVWQNGQIIWAMNYYGAVFAESVMADQVYTFLQEAMKLIEEDRPFRGPQSFENNEYKYIDESQGDMERFTGIEKIFYQGHEIYQLAYHGGSVKVKE